VAIPDAGGVCGALTMIYGNVYLQAGRSRYDRVALLQIVYRIKQRKYISVFPFMKDSNSLETL